MPDAERVFAPIKDKRHDQIFLVVEMADQSAQQHGTCLYVSIGRRLDIGGRAVHRPEEIVRRCHRILNTDRERIVIASPCSGHGFKFAPVIGQALAELSLTGRTAVDIRRFRLSRFA